MISVFIFLLARPWQLLVRPDQENPPLQISYYGCTTSIPEQFSMTEKISKPIKLMPYASRSVLFRSRYFYFPIPLLATLPSDWMRLTCHALSRLLKMLQFMIISRALKKVLKPISVNAGLPSLEVRNNVSL